MSVQSKIEFAHVGIGDALKRNRLAVPLNQREYSWEEKQISDLFQDLSGAINDNKPDYFLGTIVLTRAPNGKLEVVDGQQRLATCTVLLAAIRDYFFELNDEMLVQHMEGFLFTIDPMARERLPLLSLNVDDNEFFHHRVVLRPNDRFRKKARATKDSHKRIELAATLAANHITDLVKPLKGENRISMLNTWSSFIQTSAEIILLTAPDDVNAFVMFETLNDRGLRTTQADLLKNYLFATSNERISEAQSKWSTMRGTLESLGDDVTLTYLRHHTISQFGYTTERQVLETIRGRIKNKIRAIDFLGSLAEAAVDYVAIQTPEHAKWNKYSPSVRGQIRTLGILPATPLRPLMLAVARSFSTKNTAAAFRMFVAWSVRFLIGGGLRSGAVEKACAERSKDITDGKVSTAQQLATAMISVLPSDSSFEAAFATARVSSAKLARYYLRALELKRKGMAEPELVPNDDVVINLEHVLPESPTAGWPEFDTETIPAYYKRIGNMALMKATDNVIVGNSRFPAKKPHYKASAFLLTQAIATYSKWGPEAIDDRQRELAALAAKTWPIGLAE
jgi:hypothetical protein